MKTRYKIIIILAIGIVGIVASPSIFLVGSIQIGSLLVNSVSNETFDKEIRQLEVVKLFHQRYGNSDTYHSGDIIAWKQIGYFVGGPDDNQSAELFVKKSMFHGKIRMQFSCIYDMQALQQHHASFEQSNKTDRDDTEFALYLQDQDAILEHLTDKHCFAR